VVETQTNVETPQLSFPDSFAMDGDTFVGLKNSKGMRVICFQSDLRAGAPSWYCFGSKTV